MNEEYDYRADLLELDQLDELIEYEEETYGPCTEFTHDWQVFWKADTWAMFKCSKCETYRLMNANYINQMFGGE